MTTEDMSRSSDTETNGYVIATLRAHDAKLGVLDTKVDENTKLTQEALDYLRMAKGFFRFTAWLGRVARVMITSAAALYGLYQIFLQWWHNKPPTP